MTTYKSLHPHSIWIMRFNALIVGAILSGIVIFMRILLKNFDILDDIFLGVVDSIAIFIVLLLILNVILSPRIRYKRWKYSIDEQRVDVVTGLITIRREIIPISRIQKIELTSGPIDRMFHLANIEIVTAAGVAQIKFLTVAEAEKISVDLQRLLANSFKKVSNASIEDTSIEESGKHE